MNLIEMEFEELAMTVFGCKRWDDPWEISSADFYDSHFCEVPDEQGRNALHTIIDISVWRNQTSTDLVKSLLALKEEVSRMKTQEQAIDIITSLRRLLNII